MTIGEYIEAVTARSLFSPKTLQSYAQALRKITGDITGETKRERRDAIKLRTLTPEKIEGWRIEFIRKKATDPLREKSARISVSSFILRARALFSNETVARIRDIVEIPDPLPFGGIKAESVRVSRYRSTFNLAELLESARKELAPFRPEQYKIFLLGALAGLRRNEIDVLPWTAFRWNEGVIRIETTEHYRPKSHNSEGDVLVDPELMEVISIGQNTTLKTAAQLAIPLQGTIVKMDTAIFDRLGILAHRVAARSSSKRIFFPPGD